MTDSLSHILTVDSELAVAVRWSSMGCSFAGWAWTAALAPSCSARVTCSGRGEGQDAFPALARSTGWQVLESARMAVGRVRTDGVVLPWRLTHNVLADLVAARRPTVSSALGELIRDGLLRSVPNGWVLVGEPPGELLELGEVEPCR